MARRSNPAAAQQVTNEDLAGHLALLEEKLDVALATRPAQAGTREAYLARATLRPHFDPKTAVGFDDIITPAEHDKLFALLRRVRTADAASVR